MIDDENDDVKMDVQDLDLPCECSTIEVKDNFFVLSINKTLITELDNGTYWLDVSLTDQYHFRKNFHKF